jgi:hypothetical protein
MQLQRCLLVRNPNAEETLNNYKSMHSSRIDNSSTSSSQKFEEICFCSSQKFEEIKSYWIKNSLNLDLKIGQIRKIRVITNYLKWTYIFLAAGVTTAGIMALVVGFTERKLSFIITGLSILVLNLSFGAFLGILYSVHQDKLSRGLNDLKKQKEDITFIIDTIQKDANFKEFCNQINYPDWNEILQMKEFYELYKMNVIIERSPKQANRNIVERQSELVGILNMKTQGKFQFRDDYYPDSYSPEDFYSA